MNSIELSQSSWCELCHPTRCSVHFIRIFHIDHYFIYVGVLVCSNCFLLKLSSQLFIADIALSASVVFNLQFIELHQTRYISTCNALIGRLEIIRVIISTMIPIHIFGEINFCSNIRWNIVVFHILHNDFICKMTISDQFTLISNLLWLLQGKRSTTSQCKFEDQPINCLTL